MLPERHAIADGSGSMFDRIAQHYDFLNRCMSLGLDKGWRRHLVAALQVPAQGHILDVATGTADVALAIVKAQPQAHVTGIDTSAGMLALGRQKIARCGHNKAINLLQGDAQQLPFAAHTFDGACISFGIRNVQNRLQALKEMVRVCQPGCRIVILELSEPDAAGDITTAMLPQTPLAKLSAWRRATLQALARFHVHKVVPLLGALLSRAAEYRYLQTSIAAFMRPAAFVQLLQDAGLNAVTQKDLSFGAVQLFVGRCPQLSVAAPIANHSKPRQATSRSTAT